MISLHASSPRARQEHLLCVHQQLTECVWGCPRRLPRDPPATDDRPTEVPPGEGGGAAGMLPAAERRPGGAVQERCGEEQGLFHSFNAFCCPLMPEQMIYDNTTSDLQRWLCSVFHR